MCAAVDEQDIEWRTIMGELGLVSFLNKFMGRAVAYGAAFWGLFSRENKAADGTPPCGFLFIVDRGCGILDMLGHWKICLQVRDYLTKRYV